MSVVVANDHVINQAFIVNLRQLRILRDIWLPSKIFRFKTSFRFVKIDQNRPKVIQNLQNEAEISVKYLVPAHRIKTTHCAPMPIIQSM